MNPQYSDVIMEMLRKKFASHIVERRQDVAASWPRDLCTEHESTTLRTNLENAVIQNTATYFTVYFISKLNDCKVLRFSRR
jgi:hypothetical protein